MSSPQVVLHVEDSDEFAALVAALLTGEGFTVHRTSTLAEGEEAAKANGFACAFVDLDLPDARGLQAVMGLRHAAPDLPLIVLSGQEIDTAPVKAVLLGAQDWVGKHEISPERLTRAAALAIARQDAQSKLLWHAAHDELTGLPNRGLTLEHLTRAIGRSRRSSTRVAVLFCDVDGLKAINDGHGHADGDAVIRCVGHRLVSTLRPGDIVGRWAGDEFLVVAEGLASVEHVVSVGGRMRQEVAQPLTVGAVIHQPSITVGIALHGSRADAHLLVEAADQAMLLAKRQGDGMRVA
jgi:diguanylate cyclase (GGDEF)-like protein